MKTNLTLAQLSAEKFALQNSVLKAVEDFESATGLKVDSFSASAERITRTIGSAPKMPLVFHINIQASPGVYVQFGKGDFPF